jgi:hypothetical protein
MTVKVSSAIKTTDYHVPTTERDNAAVGMPSLGGLFELVFGQLEAERFVFIRPGRR